MCACSAHTAPTRRHAATRSAAAQAASQPGCWRPRWQAPGRLSVKGIGASMFLAKVSFRCVAPRVGRACRGSGGGTGSGERSTRRGESTAAPVASPRRVDCRPAASRPPRAPTRQGEWTPCGVESPLETLRLATPGRSTRPLHGSNRPPRAVESTSASGRIDLRERSNRPPPAVDSATESARVALESRPWRASARPIEGERRTVRPRAPGVFD